MRLLASLPQRPALAEKWKRRPRQRPEGRGVAAQPLLTAVQTLPACQTAATLPPVALQPLLAVVLPPQDTLSKPSAAPNPVSEPMSIAQGWERKVSKETATGYSKQRQSEDKGV